MSRFYPAGKWCGKYCMWCDDVVDLTDGGNECRGDCLSCDYCEEVK